MDNWRDQRKSTPKQRLFLDALTKQGSYSDLSRQKRGEPPLEDRVNVLYGGAGYGGKSYALRTAAVELCGYFRDMGFPGQWGALFCDTFPNLKKRHLGKIAKELGHLGTIKNTQLRGLHFEFYDSTLGGFYLMNASDPESFKGAEFSFVLIDELTEFSRDDYDDIVYTLRSPEKLPVLPLGAASNPDGKGHGWVKRMWVQQDFSGETVLYDPKDFIFIQAFAWDNPTYNKSVEANLSGFSDPMKVQARLHGDWNLDTGTRFSQFQNRIHVFDWADLEWSFGGELKAHEILNNKEMFLFYGSLDYGTALESASAFYIHAVDWEKRVWTLAELYLEGRGLEDQIEEMIRFVGKCPIERVYADPALQGKDDERLSRFERIKKKLPWKLVAGINDRVEGWATLDSFLHYRSDGGSITVYPKWRIHKSCRQLIRFLSDAPRDDNKLEDVDHGFKDDHAGDSARYFFHSHFKGKRKALGPQRIGFNTTEYIEHHRQERKRERLRAARKLALKW